MAIGTRPPSSNQGTVSGYARSVGPGTAVMASGIGGLLASCAHPCDGLGRAADGPGEAELLELSPNRGLHGAGPGPRRLQFGVDCRGQRRYVATRVRKARSHGVGEIGRRTPRLA